ncbi:hypothetical protein BGZ94_003347 [Podila epigama]|nr:hypothetical protein BGZ94_003347 [Podila epigama]
METIYGIQSDTATLREAHERQKRLSQQRLHEQRSALGATATKATAPATAATVFKGPPKASLLARSTSASALPTRSAQNQAQAQAQVQGQGQGQNQDDQTRQHHHSHHHHHHSNQHHKNKHSSTQSLQSQPSEFNVDHQKQDEPASQICNQRSSLDDDHIVGGGGSSSSSSSSSIFASSIRQHSGLSSSPFLTSILDGGKHSTASSSHGQLHGNISGSTTPSIGAQQSYQFPSSSSKSAIQSPAFLAKRLYDSEHRIPWLALPGAATSMSFGAGGAGTGASAAVTGHTGDLLMGNMDGGRRRSDAGIPLSRTIDGSEGSMLAIGSSAQQESSHGAHVLSHHNPHHHHLLSQQEIATLSRHGSPMPLNEALPHYLRAGQRKLSVESLDQQHKPIPASGLSSSLALSTPAMERSFSSPTASVIHTTPVSSLMHPMSSSLSVSAAAGLAAVHSHSHTPTLLSGASSAAGSGANTPMLQHHAQAQASAPSHLLFTFPAASPSLRPETERSNVTYSQAQPISRSGWLDPHAHVYPSGSSTTTATTNAH